MASTCRHRRNALRGRRAADGIVPPRWVGGVWAGVDYIGGRALLITYWESTAALHDSEPLAREMRAAAVTKAGVDRNRPPIIDRYEVVLDRHPLTA